VPTNPGSLRPAVPKGGFSTRGLPTRSCVMTKGAHESGHPPNGVLQGRWAGPGFANNFLAPAGGVPTNPGTLRQGLRKFLEKGAGDGGVAGCPKVFRPGMARGRNDISFPGTPRGSGYLVGTSRGEAGGPEKRSGGEATERTFGKLGGSAAGGSPGGAGLRLGVAWEYRRAGGGCVFASGCCCGRG